MRPQPSPSIGRDAVDHDEVVVIDLRTPADFAHGHARGALSLPFSEKGLSERLAVVVVPGTPIRLSASDSAVAAAARAQLRHRYRVVGVKVTGASRQVGPAQQSLPDIAVATLAAAVPQGDLTVLDVREPLEWDTGYVAGAVRIALGSLPERLESLSRRGLIAVICEAGVRSSTAASLLQAAGFTKVATVSEGMSGYRRAGLPVDLPETPEGS